MRRYLTPVLTLALSLAVVGTACGGDDDDDAGGSGSSDEATTDVVIEGSAFDIGGPVAPGASVTIDNRDGVGHTFTADEGAFDSGTIGGGSSGQVTAPTEPGDYAVHCEIHSSMTGTLVVEA